MNKNNRSRLSRQKVLIVSHGDHYLEVFGDDIEVKIVRVPVASTPEAEIQASEVVDMLLSPFWRDIYWPNKLKANGTTRPLKPSTLQQALGVHESVRRLNALLVDEREVAHV